MYAIRFSDFKDFYSDQGYLPFSKAHLILPEFLRSPVRMYLENDQLLFICYLLFLALLLGMILGVVGRSLTWFVWLLHFGFLQRNYAVVYGADLFANFWLLYLSLIEHNRHFTVLKSKGEAKPSDMLSSIGIRLLQIQLCISYAYTGIEKLKGTQWWEGTAVWYVLSMEELVPHDYTFLQNFPLLIASLTLATILFEVYFPAVVWNPKLKYYLLAVGFTFHLSTALFLNLPFFCLVMTCAYVLFIEPQVIKKLWNTSASYLKTRLAALSVG
jgi:hypothetical protein